MALQMADAVRPTVPQKAIHWLYTLNHYTAEDLKGLRSEDYVYHVYGREVAPGTGTPHLQGYVAFKNRKTLIQVKKLVPRAHWEGKSAKSTYLQCADYCKKDGDFVEEGVCPSTPQAIGGQATQDKWKTIRDLAMAGKLEELDPKVFVAHYKSLTQIATDYAKRAADLEDVCGIWCYGPPGSGKSHYARSLSQEYYIKPANKWWDGFHQTKHDVCLLEDLDHSSVHMGHHLKLWADKWCFAAEKKGSTIQARPKTIVVTSNYTIEELWGSDPHLCAAISRRFSVKVFDARNVVLADGSSPAQPSALDALMVAATSAVPFPGQILRRQNAMIMNRESVGELFQWEDDQSIQQVNFSPPIYVEEDESQDTGAGVGH